MTITIDDKSHVVFLLDPQEAKTLQIALFCGRKKYHSKVISQTLGMKPAEAARLLNEIDVKLAKALTLLKARKEGES